VADFLDFFAATYERTFGFDSPPLHDPVAVAAVLEPDLAYSARTKKTRTRTHTPARTDWSS
jgi:purine nucleosidase/pyrimidine-specific ribonucleoside hydrolase